MGRITRKDTKPPRPLPVDMLHRVVGGRGNATEQQPEPAVLIEQSIVASEAETQGQPAGPAPSEASSGGFGGLEATAPPVALLADAGNYNEPPAKRQESLDAARSAESTYSKALTGYQTAIEELARTSTASSDNEAAATASKEAVSKAEAALGKASADFMAKMLPAGYEPHARNPMENPWQAERNAKLELLEAREHGTDAEIEAAEKHLADTRMPDDPAARAAWHEARAQQAEMTVIKLMKTVEAVNGKIDALEKQKMKAELELNYNVAKQGDSLTRQEHLMVDLANHAATFYKPQLQDFTRLQQLVKDTTLELRMAEGLRAEVLKDLHHANVDVVLTKSFVDMEKVPREAEAHDLADAVIAIAAAAAAEIIALDQVRADVKKFNEAAQAEERTIKAAEATYKNLQDKLADYRKADPATDQRLKQLEERQRSQMEKVDHAFKNAREWQSKFEVAAKSKAEKAKLLPEAYDGLQNNANWGDRAYHEGKGFYNSHSFKVFAEALKRADGVATAQIADTRAIAESLGHLNHWKQQADSEVSRLNAIGREMELARLGGPLADKVAQDALAKAQASFAAAEDALQSSFKQVDALAQERQEAQWALEKADQARFAVERSGSAPEIALAHLESNAAYANFYRADQALHKAKANVDVFRHEEMVSLKAKLDLAKNDAAHASRWAWESERNERRDDLGIKQARADLVSAWEGWQGAVADREAALKATSAAAQNCISSAAKADIAVTAHEAAQITKQDLTLKGSAEQAAPSLTAAEKAKAALDAFKQANGATASADAQKTADKKALEDLRASAKVETPGEMQTSVFKVYDDKASLMKLELDKLRSDATTTLLKIQSALGRDLGQDMVKQFAARTDGIHKFGQDQVLAGDFYRTTMLNGMMTVDKLAQVSMKTQGEAYYNNLGAFGSAAFGLKLEAGAAMAGKAGLFDGVSAIVKGKAYAGGGFDAEAKGGVSILGLSADMLAKAHARGEVSGLSGFELGEHVTLTSGGHGVSTLDAQGKFGAKLGADGGNVKLSASAEAAVQAGYASNAQLGELNVHSSTDVWAKARAEAVAKAQAGLDTAGDFKIGARIGAEAGAGVGIQDTKSVKLLGIELESRVGAHVGTLGASAEVEFGYKDGKLKWNIDVGAALGVGLSLKLSGSIDIVEVLKNATSAFAEIIKPISSQVSHNMTVDTMKMMARNGAQVFT